MVISLTRMLQSFGQAQDDLPTIAAKNAQQAAAKEVSNNANKQGDSSDNQENLHTSASNYTLSEPQRSERICDALAQVNDIRTPTP